MATTAKLTWEDILSMKKHEQVVYHIGPCVMVSENKHIVWKAYQEGIATLTQRRTKHPDSTGRGGEFEYIIVRV